MPPTQISVLYSAAPESVLHCHSAVRTGAMHCVCVATVDCYNVQAPSLTLVHSLAPCE